MKYLILWGVIFALCARFVWWPIIKSELEDADRMIENEIKNKNNEGY